MRLLQFKNGAFVLTRILHEPPPYAILSHTWGEDEDEVTYDDITTGAGKDKKGFVKLNFCRDQAHRDGYEYFWIDTCCIDKRNDAEISSAIRSMYRWYKKAAVCYVYLSDVSMSKRAADGQPCWQDTFRSSRWFTRGWTLQELVASVRVEFFARDDHHLGNKESLGQIIHEVTRIDQRALQGRVQDFDHVTRLSWIEGRQTKVPEDKVYCMIGICGVSMGARYGEGPEDARTRLEEKVRKRFGSVALETSAASKAHSSGPTQSLQHRPEHRQAMLDLLRFDAMESRHATIKLAQQKTCEWILSNATYTAWAKPQALRNDHGFLWIKGKPGAGKSVLVKHLDRHTTKIMSKGDIRLSFYFNARGEALEKTFLGLYRSLLLQLMLAVPELQSVLDDLKATTTFGDLVNTTWKLQKKFSEALLQLRSKKLYCFIDALDECQEEDVEEMIEYLRELQQDALEKGCFLHVCFASRHFPIIDIPTKLQIVLEDVLEHTDDMGRYISKNMRSVTTATQLEQVKPDLLAKANGVFLWIVLVVDILKKEFKNGRVHAIRKRLEEIPAGLTELFQTILRRYGDNMDSFVLCANWILFAKRPLNLTEFYFAMMAGDDPDHSQELVPGKVSDAQMHAYLLSSSKGLAELTKGKLVTVQFIHESVRDFLIKDGGLKHTGDSGHWITGQSHEMLKQCCLRGMQSAAASAYMQDTRRALQALRENFSTYRHRELVSQVNKHLPFLEYASSYVLLHANEAAVNVPQDDFLSQLDLGVWIDTNNILRKHRVDHYDKPLNVVYVCAERDLTNLIKTLADLGHDIEHNSSHRFGTPLFAAFANKSENAARLILQLTGATNADEIVKEVIVERYRGKGDYERQERVLRWQWALKRPLRALTLHLVAAVFLHGSAFQQHVKETLIARAGHDTKDGATLDDHEDAASGKLRTRGGELHDAARNNHLLPAKLLLERGADVNALHGTYGTALQVAAYLGRTEIVNLLLEHGADVNVLASDNGAALQAAAYRGYTKIAQLLLEHGADVNARDGDYGTALQAAARYGNMEVVQLLLEYSADVNAEDGYYGTALQAAARHGHVEVAQLLLEHSADVNALAGDSTLR